MMRLHSSCEAFIKVYIRNKTKVCPNELLSEMKTQYPLIHQHFRPTNDGLVYYLISQGKEIIAKTGAIKATPDVKRVTRSSRAGTPASKFPTELVSLPMYSTPCTDVKKELKSNLKKRDIKAEEK